MHLDFMRDHSTAFSKNEIDSILSVGRSLENIGVRNWALEQEAALAALDQLSAIGVAVLGGDVYAVSGSNVESNYDNWYCNRESNETEIDFIKRSVAKAKSYIANYQITAGSVLFAIVPSV
ncbi:Imm40 family immunity protein [Paraherbaspirillum soli]|uniref:Imm40 family immunity protein n=1 Tax=Paraherbaspirillum soli TaxID=631222 RepID=A0ABW0MAD1_9BURK